MTADMFVERRTGPGHTVELTVLAQDPGVRDAAGNILRATVRVPAERIEPGPRGYRFHVVDYDATTGELYPAAMLTSDAALDAGGQQLLDRFQDAGDDVLLTDPAFHAQNAYAIAARTLATFEFALGRRLPWAFHHHQLYLVPHAFVEANAYYSGEDHALLFGYFIDERGATIHTCLSHDIVAHETTHAVLDGLRRRFDEPGLPDQAAFHEALADIVALLSVFSGHAVVEQLLGDPDVDGRILAAAVAPEELRRNALLVLAEQMGDAVHHQRGDGLRRSAQIEPTTSWMQDRAYEEPHLRGEILVAAFMQALLRIWTHRLRPLIHDERVDRARVAEEGAKAASHLLRMAIRAIDYLPPAEFEFPDFLEAIVVSDAEVAPDDDYDYRGALEEGFSRFGIMRPERHIKDLAEESWAPVYHGLNFAAMRTDVDEVFRFLWENGEALGIDLAHYTSVEDVRPSVRVGPDGLIVNEAVADYVQMLEATAAELAGLGLGLPPGLPAATRIRVLGGGTLIFDQFGRAKYHQYKPLGDWERQTRRLDYLVRAGLRDTRGRFGFSFGTPRGQRFAEFHRPATRAGQDW